MRITNVLCQALQQQDQDIVNVISLISSTESLIQKLHNDGLEPFLQNVKEFCV
jgi:hypothetical protein